MTSPSRVELLSIKSAALKGNQLNDPFVRELAVYLPAGYDDDPARHFPVLYLLSSHGNTSHSHLNWKAWEENLPQRLDRLMESGMEPVVVVMPDCWTRLGGSQYLDSALGNYETYLIDEIVPLVDTIFRTLADRNHRGVLGHSSGGYGALVQGMKHPELFSALACRAGDMYWEFSAMPMVAKVHQYLQKWGGFAEFIAEVPSIQPKRGSFWEAIHVVMQCMAYAPNPENPLGFDPIIDMETGALKPDVWQRWLTHDPLYMIEQVAHQDALRQMKTIFIDVGTYDEYQLQVGARLFHQKLDALDIEHHYEEFPDGHSGTNYRYDVCLPMLAEAITA